MQCGSENVEILEHAVRIDENRIARRVFMKEVSEGRIQRRQRLGCLDGVKVAFGNRGMTVEDVQKMGTSEETWCICR